MTYKINPHDGSCCWDPLLDDTMKNITELEIDIIINEQEYDQRRD